MEVINYFRCLSTLQAVIKFDTYLNQIFESNLPNSQRSVELIKLLLWRVTIRVELIALSSRPGHVVAKQWVTLLAKSHPWLHIVQALHRAVV